MYLHALFFLFLQPHCAHNTTTTSFATFRLSFETVSFLEPRVKSSTCAIYEQPVTSSAVHSRE